ncbi:MAG: ABC transporter permease [Acidobacteriota bacterium]|nr:ABC transporter permease [Acidobacteriota bacterium]
MNGTTDKRVIILVRQLLLGIIVLLVWECGIASKLVDPFFFSRPSHIAVRVFKLVITGALWPHLAITLVEAALSFAIGSLLGVVSGFVLARSPATASLFEPYLRIGNALPRIVFAPIFLLWFGLGIWSKVALGVTVVFFVVFFNTFRGLREVDRVIIDNARILGASERQLIRHVLIPSALTWIFSSLHVSIGLAIIAVVVGEYLGSSAGIGYMIAQAEGVFDTTGVFAGMTVLALGVLAVGAVVDRVERRLMRWKPERAGFGFKELG